MLCVLIRIAHRADSNEFTQYTIFNIKRKSRFGKFEIRIVRKKVESLRHFELSKFDCMSCFHYSHANLKMVIGNLYIWKSDLEQINNRLVLSM